MNYDQILFLILAIVAGLSGLGVILSSYPVRSALFLALNLLTLALIYFTLQTPFIGIVQVMVYVGAIMVLFLFVVMLLNPQAPQKIPLRESKTYIGLLATITFFTLVYTQVVMPFNHCLTPLAPKDFGSPSVIGLVLFTQYVWPFEAVSLLLLTGVVGAILLAKRRL